VQLIAPSQNPIEGHDTHPIDIERALDGREALSEEALIEFTEFFLKVSIDQIRFMEGLVQPWQLRTRILLRAVRLGKTTL
jgi:hypothetical protein